MASLTIQIVIPDTYAEEARNVLQGVAEDLVDRMDLNIDDPKAWFATLEQSGEVLSTWGTPRD